MVNHVHLLLQLSSAPELPKFMQGILQSYAIYFRKKYDSVGFVFQNRYKSIYIHSEIYLLEAARYIERNPLRAQMTDDLDDYPWSSFHHYASGKADKIIRNTHPSYFELGRNLDECRPRYREFVRIERPYDRIVDEVYKMV
jgi:putative transposase